MPQSPGMHGNSGRVGTNPLFNASPSPLSSQPGAEAGMGGGLTTPAAGGAAEAEMLQNLMNEVRRRIKWWNV